MEILDINSEWLNLLSGQGLINGYHAEFIAYRDFCYTQAEKECNKVVMKYAQKLANYYLKIYKRDKCLKH